MAYYCHLDSANRIEDTNLQLYSLEKAAEEWNELLNLANEPDYLNFNPSQERIAFIISCLGLSLSQLIGQNSPSSNSDRIESPSRLLPKVLQGISDDTTKKRLKNEFNDFLVYYDAIRHFGKVKYKSIDELTIEKLDFFLRMIIEIWDIIILKYRLDKENEIEDFTSITEIVYFESLH